MKKTKAVIIISVFVLSFFASIIFAASTFSVTLKFVSTSAQPAQKGAFIGAVKYKADETIKVTVTSASEGNAVLQWVGVLWVKAGGTLVENSKWADAPCEPKKCIKEIVLPGKAGDYKGYEVVPMAWGIIDGKVVDTAINGQVYPVEIEGVPLKVTTGPSNIKPTVKLSVTPTEVFRGDSVKIKADASASDNDLKAIIIKIPSLAKEEVKLCGHKELSTCKAEFTVTLPDPGDVSIEVTAEDLVGGETGTSDKDVATVKVNNKANVAEGLNLILVATSFFGSKLDGTMLLDFGGMYQCRSPELGVLKSSLTSYKFERVDLLYKVQNDDVAVIVYCAATEQEAYSDPYFDYGGII